MDKAQKARVKDAIIAIIGLVFAYYLLTEGLSLGWLYRWLYEERIEGPVEFGGWRFDVPDGWRVGGVTGLLTMRSPTSACDDATAGCAPTESTVFFYDNVAYDLSPGYESETYLERSLQSNIERAEGEGFENFGEIEIPLPGAKSLCRIGTKENMPSTVDIECVTDERIAQYSYVGSEEYVATFEKIVSEALRTQPAGTKKEFQYEGFAFEVPRHWTIRGRPEGLSVQRTRLSGEKPSSIIVALKANATDPLLSGGQEPERALEHWKEQLRSKGAKKIGEVVVPLASEETRCVRGLDKDTSKEVVVVFCCATGKLPLISFQGPPDDFPVFESFIKSAKRAEGTMEQKPSP